MSNLLTIGFLTLEMGSISSAVSVPTTQNSKDKFLSYLTYQSVIARSKFKPSLLG